MTNKNKRDGELSSLLIVCGLFTIVLLVVDITYSQFSQMVATWYGRFVILAHGIVMTLWVLVMLYFHEPNKDKYRKWLLGAIITTLLLVLGHRAGFIDKKMFQDDVDKNKTESNG